MNAARAAWEQLVGPARTAESRGPFVRSQLAKIASMEKLTMGPEGVTGTNASGTKRTLSWFGGPQASTQTPDGQFWKSREYQRVGNVKTQELGHWWRVGKKPSALSRHAGLKPGQSAVELVDRVGSKRTIVYKQRSLSNP
jgi:hypothetical protein